MAAGAGKVALAPIATTLTGDACPLTRTIDFVGYGTGASTPCFEGAPTANLSATTAAIRKGSGCTDTDNNGDDFTTTDTITARNSATTALVCSCQSPGAAMFPDDAE
jgi:hypothetical protein